QGRADLRRLRLYARLPGRALHARREARRDRRGHERGAAHGDRADGARRGGREPVGLRAGGLERGGSRLGGPPGSPPGRLRVVPATEAVDSFDVGSPGTRRGADLEATPLLRTSAWV